MTRIQRLIFLKRNYVALTILKLKHWKRDLNIKYLQRKIEKIEKLLK